MIIGEGPAGYAGLARAISEAQMRGEKGAPRLTLADLADAPRAGRAAWWALTGCRKGAVPAALVRDGPAAAEHALGRLVDAFGRDRVLVELWDHGDPMDRPRNDALARHRGAHRGGGGRDQQRPLRHPRPSSAGDRARGGPQPAQPRRARRLAARHPVRAPAQPGRAAPALRPLSRRGRARRRRSPRRARSTCGSRCRTCRTTRSRTVTRT